MALTFPGPSQGTPRLPQRGSELLEVRGKRGLEPGDLASSMTSSVSPSTAAVLDNCGRYHPRACIRASIGCLWCMFSAYLVFRAPHSAAVAITQYSPGTLNHCQQEVHNMSRDAESHLSSVQGTYSDVYGRGWIAKKCPTRHGTHVRRRALFTPSFTAPQPSSTHSKLSVCRSVSLATLPSSDGTIARHCLRQPPPATAAAAT